jgi:hypothetical protein
MVHQGQDLVIEFSIDKEGQWQKKDGPFVMGDWNKQRLIERRKQMHKEDDWYQQQEDWYKLQVHKSAYARDATGEDVDQLIGPLINSLNNPLNASCSSTLCVRVPQKITLVWSSCSRWRRRLKEEQYGILLPRQTVLTSRACSGTSTS